MTLAWAWGLLFSVGFATAQSAGELALTRPVWQGAEAASPVLPHGRFGLDFTLRPARNAQGSTLALFASARLPARYEPIYGGRINGAIQVIAIDAATGRVYLATAERSGAAPLSGAMIPDPPPAAPGSAAPGNVETWVNLDLRAHLGLPAHAARYRVFLWLDEFVSSVQLCRLDGAPASTTAGWPPPDRRVQWSGTPPVPSTAAITLQALTSGRVEGTVRPALLDHAQALTVFTLGFRSRRLAWHTAAIPSGPALRFDFDSSSLRETTFLVATAGAAIAVTRREAR